MLSRSLLNLVLHDDALTRGLGDAEARALVEWVVEEAERLGEAGDGPPPEAELHRLRRRGRALARFVRLWCHDALPGAACQLAASERLDAPLPDGPIDPCALMRQLVRWEAFRRAEGGGRTAEERRAA
jgi:hypothetical protein